MDHKLQARQCLPQSTSKSSTTTKKAGSSSDFSTKGNGRRRFKDNGSPSRRTTESTPAPQKWNKGSVDKRPRPRGYNSNRQREEVVEDEPQDILRSYSRKGNANELLQFHFKPREKEHHQPGRWAGHRGSHGHNRPRKTLRYNKERFLQASCQFVVQEDGEYTQQAIDPDLLVNWDKIELVRTFSTESVKCPICLSVPFAGKITKCGHIFCWACMIHYLNLGEKDYRKCPICYDAVKVEDLRSVQWVEVPDYKVGDTIEMQLMRKNKGCVYVCPKPDWTDRKGLPHNFKDGDNTKYAKLLLATKEQIQREIIDLESAALDVQLADGEEEEIPFISMAKELLLNRQKSLKLSSGARARPDKLSSELNQSSPREDSSEDKAQRISNETEDNSPIPTYIDAFSDTVFELEDNDSDGSLDDQAVALPQETDEEKKRSRMDSEGSIPFGSPINPFPLEDHPLTPQSLSPEEVHDNLELPHDGPATDPPPARRVFRPVPKDTYYFYQAMSAQHIYIHSVNARCFQQDYGSLEFCPQTISATIVSIKRMFMTEDVRKRLRYLNHIPLTCEFHVVELNLRPPLISKETLRMFKGDIDRLRKERQREAREDKVRAKLIERQHREAHGLYEDMSIPLDSPSQFPVSLNSPEPQPDTSVDSGLADSVLDGATDVEPSQVSPSPWNKSFAKIAATAGAAGSWPAAPRWGPPAHTAPAPGPRGPAGPAGGLVGEGSDEELAAPRYMDSMYAAMGGLELGLQAYLAEKEKGSTTPEMATDGKKKKKKKMQPLFSTAMARKN